MIASSPTITPAQMPIQNLITLPELIPRLRGAGVQDIAAARTLLRGAPQRASLSAQEIDHLDGAITRFEREIQFCQTFKWELLAYSEEVQAEFARKAQEVFEAPYHDARLVYLSIPTRTLRALESAGMETVGAVLRAQDALMEMRNLGQRSVGELFRILGQFARVYRYMLGNLWSTTERRLTPPLLVRAIITPLKERERDVISKRYGLDGPELTLRETGEALGISRERARQIQNRTMEKLREGTSLALIHDWVDLHLPHLLHRALLQLGGLATTQELSRKVTSAGFSLSLVADVLQYELPQLLQKQGLTPVNEELWAINPALAALAQDARRAFGHLPSHSTTLSEDQLLALVRQRFDSNHPIAQRFPPSDRFLRLVRQNLPFFD
jgi:hypothetical protein